MRFLRGLAGAVGSSLLGLGGSVFDASCGSSDDATTGLGADGSANGSSGGSSSGASNADGSTSGSSPSDAGSGDARPGPNIGTWKLEPSSTTENLYSVWGSGPNDVFAVGGAFYGQGGNGGVILRYAMRDGELAWKQERYRSEERFQDIAGTGPGHVLAVGGAFSPGPPKSGGPLGLSWDGNAWTPTDPGGNISLFGSAETDLWVTSVGVESAGTTWKVLHHEGSGWVEKKSSTEQSYGPIWAGGGHVFVAGDVVAGGKFIAHYDGTTWTQTSIDSKGIRAIWGSSPTDVYAGGNEGTFVHYDGTTWSDVKGPKIRYPILGIWGSSRWDVFVGAEGMWHFDGDVWTEESLPDAGVHHAVWDIWGSAPSDIFAVGDNGVILHRTP